MKMARQPASLDLQPLPSAPGGPLPYTPAPDEVPGVHADSPIDPPPPAIRRALKVRLHHRGFSQPLPVADPWE